MAQNVAEEKCNHRVRPFQMYMQAQVWLSMEKFSWIEHKSNGDMLQEMEEEDHRADRKMTWIGHKLSSLVKKTAKNNSGDLGGCRWTK